MTKMETLKKGQTQRSPFGFTHPHLHLNTMCPSCKNEDTQFKEEDAGRIFYTCICGAEWNFRRES